jgi:hypothetical protein
MTIRGLPLASLALALLPIPQPPPGSYRLLVVDWGLHTAIVFQQPPGWRLGPPGSEAAPYLEVAWGDRRFFAEGQRHPGAVAATLLLPTDAVLLLVAHPDPPRLQAARGAWERRVDATTLQALLTGLERSLRREPDGQRAAPLRWPAAGSARFFPAEGIYFWGRNCNWWTVRRLGDAGLARSPWGVLLPLQVPGRLIGFRPIPSGPGPLAVQDWLPPLLPADVQLRRSGAHSQPAAAGGGGRPAGAAAPLAGEPPGGPGLGSARGGRPPPS